jgi:hypothetical protein
MGVFENLKAPQVLHFLSYFHCLYNVEESCRQVHTKIAVRDRCLAVCTLGLCAAGFKAWAWEGAGLVGSGSRQVTCSDKFPDLGAYVVYQRTKRFDVSTFFPT